MRRAAVLITLLLIMCLPVVVSAQAIIIDTMHIDIWPEYDRPEVLVIYRFTLADATPLPAQMTLRIPAASVEPYNLAFFDVNDAGESSLFNLEYSTTVQGDWLHVSFSAPTRDIQLEFYDPGILRTGDRREFDLTWAADYPVQSMAVQVQQPVNATGMQIEPEMGAGSQLQDGLTYYNALFGLVEAGEEFGLQLSYEKPDDVLSKSFDPVFPSEPVDVPGQITFDSGLPWVLGGLGLLLVIGAAAWYLIPRRQAAVPRKRHLPGNTGLPDKSTGIFCHNCGTPARPGDVFCHSCGEKLRLE